MDNDLGITGNDIVLSRDPRWLRGVTWTALVLTTFLLLFDALGKLLTLAPVIEATLRLGYARHHIVWLGVVEAACTIAFLVPRTSLLGAILLTGFLGGATATHVRLDQPWSFPVISGAIVWATLLLRRRDARALVRTSLFG